MSNVQFPDDAAQQKFLLISLEEAQATVRAYDTKAQIVGIGYTFALNIVAAVVGGLPGAGAEGPVFVVLFWLVIMAPLFFFGYVLYPSRRTAPTVADTSEAEIQRALYVQTARYGTVAELRAAVSQADWTAELVYEVLKVSKLREQKRLRFITALYATVLSFAVLAAKQLWTAL